MANQKPFYKTNSLNHAAFLVVNDIVLTDIEPAKNNRGRFIFVFENSEKRESLSKKFLVGQGGDVDVHHFLNCHRQLKQLLHESYVGT